MSTRPEPELGEASLVLPRAAESRGLCMWEAGNQAGGTGIGGTCSEGSMTCAEKMRPGT